MISEAHEPQLKNKTKIRTEILKITKCRSTLPHPKHFRPDVFWNLAIFGLERYSWCISYVLCLGSGQHVDICAGRCRKGHTEIDYCYLPTCLGQAWLPMGDEKPLVFRLFGLQDCGEVKDFNYLSPGVISLTTGKEASG